MNYFPDRDRDFSLCYRVQTNVQVTQILVRWVPLALSAKVKQKVGGVNMTTNFHILQ
jgi:hypothetical protein